MKLYLPSGYSPALNIRRTEAAIPRIKEFFQHRLAENLNLERVSAPIIVRKGTGINDDLNGTERKVVLTAGEDGTELEVVNSLAKWKRMKLAMADRGGKPYSVGEGIWTDMNALRPDEELDNLHSIYVDQWDWERRISPEQRTLEFLRYIVTEIYDAIRKCERMVEQEYGIARILPEKISFITSSALESMYPPLSRKEREREYAEYTRAFFLIGIGGKLKDGNPHDGRAPDYDDWTMNGDIVVHNPILKCAFELSSMGIRVDKDSLRIQLHEAGATDRLVLDFHSRLMEDELPLTVGGGIGQSRLSMFLLRKAHIGEVQSSYWPPEMVRQCREAGIPLL